MRTTIEIATTYNHCDNDFAHPANISPGDFIIRHEVSPSEEPHPRIECEWCLQSAAGQKSSRLRLAVEDDEYKTWVLGHDVQMHPVLVEHGNRLQKMTLAQLRRERGPLALFTKKPAREMPRDAGERVNTA